MTDEFQPLLDADKIDGQSNWRDNADIADLERMYHLLFRIPNGLEPLRKKFEDHVKRAGLEAVQKVLPAPGAVSEAGKAEVLVSLPSSSTFVANGQDPKSYVEALLEVHKKYGDVVNGPFRAELGFNASLDRVSFLFGHS